MVVVLDASFLIDLRARRASALRVMEALRARGEGAVVPTTALAEFLTDSSNPSRDLDEVRRAAQVLEFGADDAANAAAVARRAHKRGLYPGLGDVLIAGFATTRGDLPIVTANPRHFPESRTVSY